MPIRRSERRIAAARIDALARGLLSASTLCAIATVSSRSRAHVNTAYFAWTPSLDVVWLSEAGAEHSRNVRERATAALAVYDSTQTWGKADRGIQLFGAARELDGPAARAAEMVYSDRFPEHETGVKSFRVYRFRPRRLKLFDEHALGAGVFVTARVSGGRVAWERTEHYVNGA